MSGLPVVATTRIPRRIEELFGRLYSFALASAVAGVLVVTVLVDSFNPVRFGAVLVLLILSHLLRTPRLFLPREVTYYAIFLAYMWLTSLWTSADVVLGLNTLLPGLDFLLTMVLCAALAAFHDRKAVLTGLLLGLLAGSAYYTLTQGFPFRYPVGFSYNAFALMYLFALFITLALAQFARPRWVLVVIALGIMGHIAATTSIKANLGIALGAVVSSLFYFRTSFKLIRRNGLVLLALFAAAGYLVLRDDALMEELSRGAERVSIGIEILKNREDPSSATSFSERQYWMREGLQGWLRNPVFGHGVEAFRADYGITSHSTVVDLLYNFGIIGCALFYAVFASVARRLVVLRMRGTETRCALILATLVCFAFITLSGTMHYNAFLAAFFAVALVLLRSSSREVQQKAASLGGLPRSAEPV